ncbi:MAG: YggS family pyridoxal phosphate-dependent enzyme [Gammaproteobacteria bacterium]|nr:YggS family pyridoxal phosphate-dependent enzyme [Gammaproteobacteria bacterium]
MTIAQNLQHVCKRIADTAQRCHRSAHTVNLLAVSKTRSIDDIVHAINAGQTRFGENQLQEAITKINALQDYHLEWHFIGHIQSNKTREIAHYFTWVHSIDRYKIAKRLNEQRPAHMPPLNICLQINLDEEATKSGITIDELPPLIIKIQSLTHLHLRGLMAIPAKQQDYHAQQNTFAKLRRAFVELQQQGFPLDTLSMGMSHDLEAAIEQGATIVRIGTDIFGERREKTC